MAQAGIDVELVLDLGLVERGTKPFDVVHARTGVLIAPVAEDRATHLRREVNRRRVGARVGREAVVRDRCGDALFPGREQQDHRAAHAEADRSDQPVHISSRAKPVDPGRHVTAPTLEVELLRARHRRVARRLGERALAKEVLGCRRNEPRLCEPPREVVVERAAAEDVVDDQDPRRGNAFREREKPGHRRATLHRDGRFFDAHIGDRSAGRNFGMAHLCLTSCGHGRRTARV